MYFAIIGHDGPDAAVLREQFLSDHLAYIEHVLESEDLIRVAGPLRETDGSTTTGSLLVVEAEEVSRVREFVHADPYYRAGVWSQVLITPFSAVAGSWVGGRTW